MYTELGERTEKVLFYIIRTNFTNNFALDGNGAAFNFDSTKSAILFIFIKLDYLLLRDNYAFDDRHAISIAFSPLKSN